jgi:hypothetical protein
MLRLALPLLAFAALSPLTAEPAEAASLTQSATGNRLELRLDCPADVEIRPRADLSGKVEVEATADRDNRLDGLHVTGGDAVTVEDRGHCGFFSGAGEFRLSIGVPAGFALDIKQSGAGKFDIGAVGGPLALDIAGAGEIHAEQVGSLDLHCAGAAQVEVRRLDGPGKIFQGGGGDITIGGGRITTLRFDLNGASNVEVERGDIDKLEIQMNGAGNAEIHAVVGDASLKIAGIGRIQVDRVTGQVHRDVAGLGVIDVGE